MSILTGRCGFELQGFTTIQCYAIIPSRIIDTDLNNKDLSFSWRHLYGWFLRKVFENQSHGQAL